MAGEEDVELRDLVAHTLETRGVLGNIRAQLRASVFLALEEQESQQKPHPLVSSKFQEYLKTKDGKIATALVREFLHFFDLDYTCSVFDPETNALEVCPGRDELAKDLDLDATTSTGPLLNTLLQRVTSSSPALIQQPLSTTSVPRQHHDSSANNMNPTTTAAAAAPPAHSSLSVMLTTSTITTTSTAQIVTNSSVHGEDKSQMDKIHKKDENTLPVLSTHPVNFSAMPAATEHAASELVTGPLVTNSASNTLQHNVNLSDEEQLNGKSGDELDDFFGKKPPSFLDDSDPRKSLSEHLDHRVMGKYSNKYEETEDVTLSQTSLTEFDYAEPAKT